MSVFDRLFDMDEQRFLENPVYSALFQSEQRAWKALQELKSPLTLRESARCLRKALIDGSPELFQQILEHSESGECAEQYNIPVRSIGWGINGYGSLLMLAAMMERPRQAEMLLERGYNCNGAGLPLSQYLRKDENSWGEFVPPNGRFCGCAGTQIRIIRLSEKDLSIACPTPLVAALLCGNLQTAKVLLRQPGIWKGESSAVCRAAVMVLEGQTRLLLSEKQQENQREILRLIFCPEQETLPEREALLRSVPLQSTSFVDFCGVSALRGQLEGGFCTEADVRQMLEILSDAAWWPHMSVDRSKAGKLLLLKRYFPQVCREEWVGGIFLREILLRLREKCPYKNLLNAWKQLCGKERDLTWMSDSVWALNTRELRQFLKEAGAGGTLVMDADALSRWYGAQYQTMMTLLNGVKFRQRDGEGVSGLMQRLLLMNDLRVLSRAANLGMLEREDPKMLLECLLESGGENQAARAMVLTYAKNKPVPNENRGNWRDPKRWEHWCLWEFLDEAGAQTVIAPLLRGDLSREACLRYLFRTHQYLKQEMFAPDVPVNDPRYPTLQTDSLAGIACCSERKQVMELLMELWPALLLRTVRANWGDHLYFHGTPLALSAALGRIEQVKLLLESGVHPDEPGRGDSSRFFLRRSNFVEESVIVTPLLAAILFGQNETAKLLIEAGAELDFSNPSHRQVLSMGNAAALKLAEELDGPGFRAISKEELENLRFTASNGGAKGVLWSCLENGGDRS